MFSSFGNANQPYGGGGRVNLKRQLFGKKKSISLQSEGLDLHKVKGQHCVETWATHYNKEDPQLSSNNVNNVNISNERLNRVNLISSSPTCSTFLDKVEESKLVTKEQQEKEKEVNRRKVPSPCRSDLRPLEVV